MPMTRSLDRIASPGRLCAAVAMALGAFLYAATPAVADAPARSHDIVADDYFTIDAMADLAVSPDGAHTAFVLLRWDEPSDGRNADLWVVNHGERVPRRLTFDQAADTHPAWSPDGRWIYFTSARSLGDEDTPPFDGSTQVWRIGIDGQGLAPVTRVADGIAQFQLSDDGASLYYVVKHEQVGDDWKALRAKFDKLTYGHGVVNFSQLWKLNLQSWRAEKLVDDKRVIGAFTVTPDERRIAMITTPTEQLITNEGRSRVDIYDVASKAITALADRQWREQAPSPYGWLESPAWSHDGRALAFAVSFDGYPSEVFVATFGDDRMSIRKLERENEISVEPGAGLAWRGASHDLLLKAEDHARARVYLVRDAAGDDQGETVVLTPGDVCVDRFGCTRDGRTAAVIMSGLTHPPDLFTIAADKPASDYARITKVNPQVDTWKLPSLQIVKWTSPDGTPVEGILELPPDHTPGKPLPMIVELHGGPTAASLYRLRFWIYGRVLMPAQGYALLTPNYRGSTGYGDRFMTELIGHKNNRDVADILTGVDAMVERGIADPDRLGVMGWSNGGYLTNCLITTTTRFKAASSGAGVIDAAMQWAT